MVAPTLKGEGDNPFFAHKIGNAPNRVPPWGGDIAPKAREVSLNKKPRGTCRPPAGRIQGQQPLVRFLASVLCRIAKNAKNRLNIAVPKQRIGQVINTADKSSLRAFFQESEKPSQYCGTKTMNRTIQQQRGKKFFASFLSRKRKNRLHPTIQKQSIGQVNNNADKVSLPTFFSKKVRSKKIEKNLAFPLYLCYNKARKNTGRL